MIVGHYPEAQSSLCKAMELGNSEELVPLITLCMLMMNNKDEAARLVTANGGREPSSKLLTAVVDSVRYFTINVDRTQNADKALAWSTFWSELWEGNPECEVPLKMLRVTAESLRGNDNTVLLSLPSEQRKLLLPLLDLTEEDMQHL